MLKVYGTMLCPDCRACAREFEEKGVQFEFFEFNDKLENLKKFLRMRDQNPVFDAAKENGAIGIPCIETEDETVTLDWEAFVSEEVRA